MTGAMGGFRGFLCTHQEMNVTVIYRCVRPQIASVLHVFSSVEEPNLLAHPALTYCCAASCCDLNPLTKLANNARSKTTQKPNLGLTYTYGTPGLGSGLASPRLWTSLLGFIVILLAIFMIFQNVVSFKRAKKILPLLQKESAGPYSDTTVKDGIILPKVTYREDVAEEGRENEKSSQLSQVGDAAKSKKQARSLGMSSRQTSTLSQLNPTELLALTCVGEDDRKIIEEEENQLEERVRGRGEEGTHDLMSSEVEIVPPLEPAYYPGRQVRRLWQGGQDNNLYRYTHLDRLVYPPGYIV